MLDWQQTSKARPLSVYTYTDTYDTIGNLNINSLPKKFDNLKEHETRMLDILIITETKLDNTFLVSQFHIDGYSKRYRLDRNRNGGGIIIYVRKDISNRMLIKTTCQIISMVYL